MSPARKKGGKGRGAGKPIVLPREFAPRSAAAEQSLLYPDQAAQIQQLADLLKRNHLTELEIERSGVRIRIRHEPAVRTTPVHVAESAHAQVTVLPPPQSLNLTRQRARKGRSPLRPRSSAPFTVRPRRMPIPMSKKETMSDVGRSCASSRP